MDNIPISVESQHITEAPTRMITDEFRACQYLQGSLIEDHDNPLSLSIVRLRQKGRAWADIADRHSISIEVAQQIYRKASQ